MSESIVVGLIAAIAPTLAVAVTWHAQNRRHRKEGKRIRIEVKRLKREVLQLKGLLATERLDGK